MVHSGYYVVIRLQRTGEEAGKVVGKCCIHPSEKLQWLRPESSSGSGEKRNDQILDIF